MAKTGKKTTSRTTTKKATGKTGLSGSAGSSGSAKSTRSAQANPGRSGFDDFKALLLQASDQVRKTAAEVRADPRYQDAADAALAGLHGAAATLRGLVEKVESDLDERRPHATGATVGGGRYNCRACGTAVILATPQRLPACASCGGRKFRLAS